MGRNNQDHVLRWRRRRYCGGFMAEARAAQVGATQQTSSPAAIQMIGLHKWYGEFHVLRNINLVVDQGEKIVICGPSGSGKSTLIRCINRLEEHQQGQLIVEGTELTNDVRQIDKIRADVGMVFQSFNLFPAPDRSRQSLPRARVGEEDAPRAGGENRHAISGARQDPRAGAQISRPALGRPAAARRHRARAVHEPAHHAVRRADERARSRDDQGSARRHDRAGRGPA